MVWAETDSDYTAHRTVQFSDTAYLKHKHNISISFNARIILRLVVLQTK